MVLDAISRRVKTIDKIAKVTRLDKAEVELIVNDLVAQRLVIGEEKKKIFGGKKLEFSVSHTGLQLLNSKKLELEKQAQQVQQWYQSGQTQQLQSYMDGNRMWIPMMLFSAMMSLTGMAMSPAETGFAGDVGSDAGAAADVSGGDAGADAGGDFGGGDFGGGDFSF